MCHFLRVHYTGCGHDMTLNNIFPCSRLSIYNCDLGNWLPDWTGLNSIAARHVYVSEVGARCGTCTERYVHERLSCTGVESYDDDGYLTCYSSYGTLGPSTISEDTTKGVADLNVAGGGGGGGGPSPSDSMVTYWNRVRDDLLPSPDSESRETPVDEHIGHVGTMAQAEPPKYEYMQSQVGTGGGGGADGTAAEVSSPDLRCRAGDCARRVRRNGKYLEQGDYCFRHKWLVWNWRAWWKRRGNAATATRRSDLI